MVQENKNTKQVISFNKSASSPEWRQLRPRETNNGSEVKCEFAENENPQNWGLFQQQVIVGCYSGVEREKARQWKHWNQCTKKVESWGTNYMHS